MRFTSIVVALTFVTGFALPAPAADAADAVAARAINVLKIKASDPDFKIKAGASPWSI